MGTMCTLFRQYLYDGIDKKWPISFLTKFKQQQKQHNYKEPPRDFRLTRNDHDHDGDDHARNGRDHDGRVHSGRAHGGDHGDGDHGLINN